MSNIDIVNAAKKAAKEQGVDWTSEHDDYFGQMQGDVENWYADRPHQDVIDYSIQQESK